MERLESIETYLNIPVEILCLVELVKHCPHLKSLIMPVRDTSMLPLWRTQHG